MRKYVKRGRQWTRESIFCFLFFIFVKNVKYIEIRIVRFHFIWNFSDFTSDEKIC